MNPLPFPSLSWFSCSLSTTIASDPMLRILLRMDAQEVGHGRDATADEPWRPAHDLLAPHVPLRLLQSLFFWQLSGFSCSRDRHWNHRVRFWSSSWNRKCRWSEDSGRRNCDGGYSNHNDHRVTVTATVILFLLWMTDTSVLLRWWFRPDPSPRFFLPEKWIDYPFVHIYFYCVLNHSCQKYPCTILFTLSIALPPPPLSLPIFLLFLPTCTRKPTTHFSTILRNAQKNKKQ